MSVIYVVFPLAACLSLAALWAFIRAVRAGQFDDADTPALLPLLDDEAEGGPDRAGPPTAVRNRRSSTPRACPALNSRQSTP